MLGLLRAILCWIKQIGAMVLNALIDALNVILAAFVDAVNLLINEWPVAMPDLPSLPPELVEAIGWLRWSPLPVDAGLAFLLFMVTVWLLWIVVVPILRWAKAVD